MNGIEIRARREALGLSQSGLAAMLGVAQAAVSRWENGERTPAPDRAVAIHLVLSAAEETLAELIEQAVELMEHASAVRDSPVIEFRTFASDADFWAADAGARERQVPASLHRVAAAHAAFEVREEHEITVRIVS